MNSVNECFVDFCSIPKGSKILESIINPQGVFNIVEYQFDVVLTVLNFVLFAAGSQRQVQDKTFFLGLLRFQKNITFYFD